MNASRGMGLALASLVAIAAASTAAVTSTSAQAPPAGLDLVFLVDGSGSIDAGDWSIQKAGIATALQDRSSFPLDGSVAVAVIQWSSSTETEIPYTVLDSEATRDSVVAEVNAMNQNGGGTSPHLGINAGTTLLSTQQNPASEQVFCLSTDGNPSSQGLLTSATANAQASGVERHSVLAIEDPPFFDANDAQVRYGPAVFGGGTVVTTRNAAEFAALVTGACLGAPVELVGLEVNQAVQDWSNSVALVAGKQTIVRAHVQSLDTTAVRAIGRLYGERNGVELPSSPLLPLNAAGSVLAGQDAIAERADIDASLNFALPPDWRSGNVQLRLELVGGGVVCSEAAPPAGTCRADVGFQTVATPSLRMVEVIYEDSSGTEQTVTVGERDEQAARIVSAMPVASVDYTNAELSTRFVEPATEDEREDFLADVNESLLTARSNDGLNDLYLGVLKDSIPDGGGGLAAGIQANAASWFMSGTEDREAYGYARNRGAHEFGHTVGERHAADADDGDTYCSGGRSAGSGAVEYPFVTTIGSTDYPTLSDLGDPDTEAWGVDPRFVIDGSNDDLAVVDPNETFALMGYCNSLDNTSQGRWIDSFYWPRFIDDIDAIDWDVGPVPDGGGVWGFVRGLWPFDAPADVEFRPYFENSPGFVPTAMPTGDFALELRDATGTVLRAVDFEPYVFEGDAAEDGSEATAHAMFVIPVENPPEYATAVVVDDAGQEVGTLVASPNPPSVSITAPVAGASFTGSTIDAAWTGSDPDGDDLVYTVLYSTDGGATWETQGVDLTDTSISFERQEVGGSTQARIRVIASDGTRSATADSPLFSVGNNAPALTIRTPLDGQFFSGVQSVFFEASAIDAEDGPLAGAGVVWQSDLDGTLGTGTELVALASDLTEGVHVITATATDSAGASTARSVGIEVARVGEPPMDDETPPTIVAVPDRPANAAGWWSGAVTFTFTCEDDDSGVATCPDPVEVITEGADQSFEVTATDNAGNTGTLLVDGIDIDSTGPTVTFAGDLAADGAAFILRQPITAEFTCSDALSGVASCDGDQPTGSMLDTTSSGAFSFSVTGIDAADNATTGTRSYTVDGDPNCPSGDVDGNLTLSGSCYIAAGITIDGNLDATGEIILAGVVTGNVDVAGGSFTVDGGVVGGNVEQVGAGGIVIRSAGFVDGNLKQRGPGGITIGAGAEVTGNVDEKGDGSVILDGIVRGHVKESGDGHVDVLGAATVDKSVTEKNDGALTVLAGALIDKDVSESGAGTCSIDQLATIGGKLRGDC